MLMNMSTECTSLVLSSLKASLPAFAQGNVTYNDCAKMFLTQGWASAAGNVYQEGLRVSRNLVVTYGIGHGYCHSFLNSIRIYRFEQNRPVLATERYFYNFWWSDYDVKTATVNLLTDFLESQCKVLGLDSPGREAVRQLAGGFVNETIAGTKLLAQ
jgi:hypothetical protein